MWKLREEEYYGVVYRSVSLHICGALWYVIFNKNNDNRNYTAYIKRIVRWGWKIPCRWTGVGSHVVVACRIHYRFDFSVYHRFLIRWLLLYRVTTTMIGFNQCFKSYSSVHLIPYLLQCNSNMFLSTRTGNIFWRLYSFIVSILYLNFPEITLNRFV